mmetsp:Transcript_20954/g.58929  ORF Transcript_20954/g.58929 Transcript_20954/m.58929 type:complete len:502 (+) Transcript_20954:1747-3252(+)
MKSSTALAAFTASSKVRAQGEAPTCAPSPAPASSEGAPPVPEGVGSRELHTRRHTGQRNSPPRTSKRNMPSYLSPPRSLVLSPSQYLCRQASCTTCPHDCTCRPGKASWRPSPTGVVCVAHPLPSACWLPKACSGLSSLLPAFRFRSALWPTLASISAALISGHSAERTDDPMCPGWVPISTQRTGEALLCLWTASVHVPGLLAASSGMLLTWVRAIIPSGEPPSVSPWHRTQVAGHASGCDDALERTPDELAGACSPMATSSPSESSSASNAAKAACLAAISAIAASWLRLTAAFHSMLLGESAGGAPPDRLASMELTLSELTCCSRRPRRCWAQATSISSGLVVKSPNCRAAFRPCRRPSSCRMECEPGGRCCTASRTHPPRKPPGGARPHTSMPIVPTDTPRGPSASLNICCASPFRERARESSCMAQMLISAQLPSSPCTQYCKTDHTSWCRAGEASTARARSKGAGALSGGSSCHSGFQAPDSMDRSRASSRCSRE